MCALRCFSLLLSAFTAAVGCNNDCVMCALRCTWMLTCALGMQRPDTVTSTAHPCNSAMVKKRGGDNCDRVQVIHLDIKPANILLDHHCDIKLVDFGFAAAFPPDRPELFIADGRGTPRYTAPEMVCPRPALVDCTAKSARSSIWWWLFLCFGSLGLSILSEAYIGCYALLLERAVLLRVGRSNACAIWQQRLSSGSVC